MDLKGCDGRLPSLFVPANRIASPTNRSVAATAPNGKIG